MYDPRAPNSYDAVVQHRLAEEAALARVQQANKQAAAEAQARADAQARAEASQARVLAAASQAGVALSADLSPEELRKQRLAVSAKLGVHAAIEMQRDDHEAALKERRALGLDSASKASRFLAKLGAVDGQSIGGSGDGLTNHLVNVRSGMAAGGNVLVPMAGLGPAQKSVIKGKPSATLLIRNAAVEPSEELLVDIQSKCGDFGVVRSVRLHVVEQLPEGWSAANRVRVFVRFDSVAAAFKAAEALNGRTYDERPILVSFYNTALLEKSALDPQPDEERLP